MDINEAIEYSKKVVRSNDFSPGYIQYHQFVMCWLEELKYARTKLLGDKTKEIPIPKKEIPEEGINIDIYA